MHYKGLPVRTRILWRVGLATSAGREHVPALGGQVLLGVISRKILRGAARHHAGVEVSEAELSEGRGTNGGAKEDLIKLRANILPPSGSAY